MWIRARSAKTEEDEDGVGDALELRVMPYETWQIVKWRMRRQSEFRNVPDENIRLLWRGRELENDMTVVEYDLGDTTQEEPVEIQYLIISSCDARVIGLYTDSQVNEACPPDLTRLASDALAAMTSGVMPELTKQGTGATYFLRDASQRRVLAVFKPKDEEANAPNNPRGYVGEANSTSLREGVLSTQQSEREVAAFVLDHDHFAGVPETTLVHARHPKFVQVTVNAGGPERVVWKVGAFQAFVEAISDAEDWGHVKFSTGNVHRIGILDVRIVNLDRNDGNLLVTESMELVPIDHGLSLPDRLDVYTDDLRWMSWPQAKMPFGEQEKRYIKKLDGVKDARLMGKLLGIRRDCLRLLEVTTLLLQIAAEHDLTLFEIGTIMYRERNYDGDQEPSVLERMIRTCVDSAHASLKLHQAHTGRGTVRVERHSQESSGGIFYQPSLRSNDWSPHLEAVFREHMREAIKKHVEKVASAKARDVEEQLLPTQPLPFACDRCGKRCANKVLFAMHCRKCIAD